MARPQFWRCLSAQLKTGNPGLAQIQRFEEEHRIPFRGEQNGVVRIHLREQRVLNHLVVFSTKLQLQATSSPFPFDLLDQSNFPIVAGLTDQVNVANDVNVVAQTAFHVTLSQ